MIRLLIIVALAVNSLTMPTYTVRTPQIITIDFDNIDTSTSGTAPLADQYRYLGVTFLTKGHAGRWESYATAVRDGLWGNGATSLPNAVMYGDYRYVVDIVFVDPVSGQPAVTDFVSAMVGDRSGEPDLITMTAFGLDGHVIGTASYTSWFSGDFGPVSIAVPKIHRVELVDADGSGADFDDFTFGPVHSIQAGID